jgi:hypothetical protein
MLVHISLNYLGGGGCCALLSRILRFDFNVSGQNG